VTLVEALRGLPWFAHVPEPSLAALAADSRVVSLADDQIVMREDEVVSDVVVVLDGCLGATCVDRLGATRRLPDIVAGHLTGETQEATRWMAPATLRARGATTVALMPAETMIRFAQANPAAALRLHEELRPHLERQRLTAAVHDSAAFAGVEGSLLDEIAALLEPVSLYGGEILFRQGEAGDTVYLVVSGRLVVLVTQPDGEVRTVAELGGGEVVGEMAYLSATPRSATVVAVRDTQLARLTRVALDSLVERHPQAMLRLLSGRVVARVHDMSRGRRPHAPVVTVAIVPAAPDVPIHDVATRLTTALASVGSVRHVTSAAVDAALGHSGAAQVPDRSGGRLVQWLAQLEADHRVVVYEGDARNTPWTERCVRQADRILLVADAAGDVAPGDIETHLLGPHVRGRQRHTLVLLHPLSTTAPSGTARWLTGRPPIRHLHVRLDAPEDVARLGRFVTGRTVALALGGGFARGLAHLGVFRALEELGIPVDAVGGASMGAMVGAQWVSGWPAERISADTSTGLADSFDDMTLPFLAFKRGGKYSRLVRRFFGEARIEDMWRPYFAVSANLNRAEVAIHTQGRIADAVLASTRAPGIFPPLVMQGELHVDGGLINNVPVDVMRDFAGEGVVIGVDVSPPHELHTVHDYGEDVSGWSALWRRFTPARDRRIYRPSILLVLMRVVEFGGISYRRQKAGMADVYISPDVLRFKRNDFHAAAGLADAGYAAARQELRAWLDRQAVTSVDRVDARL
jgi:predicted acylesterase/phospholipase RssA/CRP-like cAMP-binding protein